LRFRAILLAIHCSSFPKFGCAGSNRYNTRFLIMTQPPKTRREMLEGFVAGSPNDAFARYGLALECAKQGDNDAAVGHFRELLKANPGYVTGYFQFGQLLARIGRVPEAREQLFGGIAAAQTAGDTHAQEEMEAALAALN
jgi:tetratricopeptide (TPR) repeat protein